MSQESDRMMVLLQELATLKKTHRGRDNVTVKKRRREIGKEIKQLAAEKQRANEEA